MTSFRKQLYPVVLGAVACLLAARSANALSPESPEVKKLVDKGLGFLSTVHPSEVGEKVLVSLAFVKAGRKEEPLVKETVRNLNKGEFDQIAYQYSLALSVVLLCEMEDQNLDPMAQQLLDHLLSRQKPHGGFGYVGSPSGDISQNQYAAIALWTAKTHGLKVPDDTVINCLNYVIRLQDPTGGWPYQGTDPGNYQRQNQTIGPPSIGIGGLAALFILCDTLGLKSKPGANEQEDTGFSSALKTVEPKTTDQGVSAEEKYAGKIDKGLIEKAMRDGTAWLAQNHKLPLSSWNNYYLYGIERAESFRDVYNRKVRKDPPWYDQGAKYLASSQQGNGSWVGNSSQDSTVPTALAILFLLRSTQKSIAKVHKDLGDGVLSSGKGLPTDLANASVKRGRIVDSTLAGQVDDVVALLDDPDNPELKRFIEGSSDAKIDPELLKRNGQITKLRAAVSAESWEARMVAVKALGRTRDLESVPQLIYAMTDPDLTVVKEADRALRFLSRKFQGVGLPDDPQKEDIQKARLAWRKWYLSIRPNAQFLE